MADNNAGGGNGDKWYKKPLVYVLGLLGLVVTGVFTGLGQDAYNEIQRHLPGFETSVDGYVKRGDVAVQGANVALDDGTRQITSPSGHFLFDDVSRGRHTISVEEAGTLLYWDSFTISRDEEGKEVTLPDILLDAVPEPSSAQGSDDTLPKQPNPAYSVEQATVDVPLELAYLASPIDSGAAPADGSNTHSLTVWIAGTQEQLADIESVTYYLHPTFQPSVVTRYSPADAFRLDFTAWGQFEIHARLLFRDGRVSDLSKYLAF